MKYIVIYLIKFYQKYLSKLKPPCCRYYPTCSQYTLEAVRRFGAIRGLILGFWRILRCNPYSKGGIDYVPEKWHLYTLKSENRRKAKAQLRNTRATSHNKGENQP
ncbi:MAG: membrane protein insertion efficiency factor YidD [Oscillospiraceae bacterium]|nr:membrane protein insertion efficiency factor YidD [Oscillospiraceae bacterium]